MIKKVSVIGSGLMGRQIAMQCALHGYDVFCYDVNTKMVEEARAFSGGWFASQIEKGKLLAEEAEAVQKRLVFTGDVNAAARDTDFILEAVSDVGEIKRAALKAFDALTPDHCIYASNSSYIVSSAFCDAVKDPSKVLNVHFFNPALVMKVVEIVKGPHVSEQTFQTAYSFVESIGKTPVKINKEIYGFVVNRCFNALTKEACNLVDLGVASPEEIDKAVRGALGHSMGPLETLDMTGLDLEYVVSMERFKSTGDKADRPAVCITERVARGEFGRKTGKGFYEYSQKA